MKANPNLPQRIITRHSSNQGSVVTLDMYGKTVELFVADAKYRGVAKLGTYGTDIGLDNFASDLKYINPTDTNDIDSSLLNYTLSDSQLQARFPSFKADKTARENTDVLMRYSDTNAAHYCRNQNIAGVGRCDLPNIYELMAIYLESDRLDELDPTVDEYPQYALGKKNTYGRFDFESVDANWSSTVYNAYNMRNVYYSGYTGINFKYCSHGVIPVKELNIN